MALALAFALFLGKGFRILGEVPAEDNRGCPDVPDQVGAHVTGQHNRGHGQGQQREEDIILEGLAATLAGEVLQERQLVAPAQLTPANFLALQFMHAHTPLEQYRQQDVVHELQQVPWCHFTSSPKRSTA